MDIKLKEILAQSMDRGTLNPDAIPELDLYIDQIISLMDKYVPRRDEDQPPLTRTMIHNYSKAGLISPVKGKKYSKEHIMQMFAIYSLKNTLSIAQVKRVLCALRDDEDGDVLNESYQEYLTNRTEVHDALCESVEHMMDGIESDDYKELYSRLLLLADASQMLTDFARQLAEQCFPDPPAKSKKKES